MEDSELIQKICNTFLKMYSMGDDFKCMKSYDIYVSDIIFNTLLEKKLKHSEKTMKDFLMTMSDSIFGIHKDDIIMRSGKILSKNDNTIIIIYNFFHMDTYFKDDPPLYNFCLVINKNPNETKSGRNIIS